MPFPIYKLVVLLAKQMSKPLASVVKTAAKSSTRFNRFCILTANFYHRSDVNAKLKLLGMGKSKNVKPLDPDTAVKLGADLIGEVFIYAFAVVLLFSTERSSSAKSRSKDEEHDDEIETLQKQMIELELSAAVMDGEIRHLQRTVGQLESENTALTEKVFPKKRKG